MVPQNDGWSAMIEQQYASDCEKVFRCSIKKTEIFDREKLRSYIKILQQEYKLKMIDEALFHHSKTESWSRDLCSQFPSYEAYRTHGTDLDLINRWLNKEHVLTWYHDADEWLNEIRKLNEANSCLI